MTKQNLIKRLSDNHLIHRKRVKRQSEESANIINPLASRTCFQRPPPAREPKNSKQSPIQSSSRISIMGFVNEVVSDEDIERYGLPFKKGSGRYWTRDAERNYYLWGGLQGNRAIDEDVQWRFHFFDGQQKISFSLKRGKGSVKLSESPYIIHWVSIEELDIPDYSAQERELILDLLREALLAFGEGGKGNSRIQNLEVRFGF